MKKILFQDQIWHDSQQRIYSARLAETLVSRDLLIVIKNGLPPYRVVIGVPHQAAIGEKKIAENWTNPFGEKGRDSDENAASFALVAFATLSEQNVPCKLVIAAHATENDPNKAAGSAYFEEIFCEANRLFFECHGAGQRRKHDLELSAGSNPLGNALAFGRRLAKCLDYRYVLAAQIEAGARDALEICKDGERKTPLTLPALETTSLTAAAKQGIEALHLEARPRFRIPEGDGRSVSEDGWALGRAITECLCSSRSLMES